MTVKPNCSFEINPTSYCSIPRDWKEKCGEEQGSDVFLKEPYLKSWMCAYLTMPHKKHDNIPRPFNL